MELDLIKQYYDTQVEALERDLTKLSLGPVTFDYANKVKDTSVIQNFLKTKWTKVTQ